MSLLSAQWGLASHNDVVRECGQARVDREETTMLPLGVGRETTQACCPIAIISTERNATYIKDYILGLSVSSHCFHLLQLHEASPEPYRRLAQSSLSMLGPIARYRNPDATAWILLAAAVKRDSRACAHRQHQVGHHLASQRSG